MLEAGGSWIENTLSALTLWHGSLLTNAFSSSTVSGLYPMLQAFAIQLSNGSMNHCIDQKEDGEVLYWVLFKPDGGHLCL